MAMGQNSAKGVKQAFEKDQNRKPWGGYIKGSNGYQAKSVLTHRILPQFFVTASAISVEAEAADVG